MLKLIKLNNANDFLNKILKITKIEFKEKVKLRRFLNKQKCNFLNINRGIIEYCLKSKARIAIIAAQDILNLDDSARINLPRKLRNRKLVLGNVRF